MTIIATKF